MVPRQELSARPVIFDYQAVGDYVSSMLQWRKSVEPSFSVSAATKSLPGCSKALVTRVIKGERRITRDRVESFAALLALTPQETSYLDRWVASGDPRTRAPRARRPVLRKPQNHLLSDWVNVYVKDALHLRGFEPDATVVHRLLGGLASVNRIARSLKFLFAEGFFRKTPEGCVVLNATDEFTTDEVPDRRITEFHKRALDIAKDGLDRYPTAARRADAYVLALNAENLAKLKHLLTECMDQVVQFRAEHAADNERLYQVIMHLTPIGEQHDA